jgi:hypothetical protein
VPLAGFTFPGPQTPNPSGGTLKGSRMRAGVLRPLPGSEARFLRGARLSLSHTHTHTHTHFPLSLSHTHTHFPLSLTHTHTLLSRYLSRSRSLSLTHFPFSLSHTHTHTLLSLYLSRSRSLSLTHTHFPVSLSHTHTLSLSRSLSLSLTHTHFSFQVAPWKAAACGREYCDLYQDLKRAFCGERPCETADEGAR